MIFQVKVTPNAKKNEIIERTESGLKVKIKAPSIENKANQELIKFLSETFGTAKSNIIILKGEKNRNKVVEIKD